MPQFSISQWSHREHIIQVHLGHCGTHDVKHVGGDLLVAVCELVELRRGSREWGSCVSFTAGRLV